MRLDLSKMGLATVKHNSQVNVASGDVFEDMYSGVPPYAVQKSDMVKINRPSKGKKTVIIRRWNPGWDHMATPATEIIY